MTKALPSRNSTLVFVSIVTALAAGSGCAANAGDGGSGGTDPGSGGAIAESGGATNGTGGASTGGAGTATGGTGTGGASTGGAGSGGTPASDCTPNPSGTFVVDGEAVFDEKTCLTWMKTNETGQDYATAVAYCESLSLGGFDDYRLPTAGEVVSIFKCDGTFPPLATVFTASGDGIWTTTETGTIAGDQTKVCGAGQSSGQFYDFGKVGAQNTRCVRGPSTLPDRTDCKEVTQICAP